MKEKLTRERANCTAVKNKLCRIEDDLTGIFIGIQEEEAIKAIMRARHDIDKCVEALEDLIPRL